MRSINGSYAGRKLPPVSEIVKDLFNKNFLLRKRAREELVEIGEPGLDYLIEMANNKNEAIRWEAIRLIVQIGSEDTLDVLLTALEDDEFSIRWLAAKGLINLGKYSILPLLETLLEKSDSTFIRRGAHHILKELRRKGLFRDRVGLIETLANEFDHSNVLWKVHECINFN
jgi:HEAT repeat protein